MRQKSAQKSKGIGAFLATIGLLILTKLKWLLALLKLSKFGVTFISMMVSLGGYALFYGWKFAVALIYLILVHEMGHLVAAKQKGIKTSPAVFIPFLGAAIAMKEQPKDAKTEAYIAYGGPLAGLLSFLPAVLLYFLTNDQFWALVIMLGALLNLFNLFPVSPLDGGRIVSVLSTKIWFVGLLLIFPVLFVSPDPILVLIFIFGFFTWWNRARDNYKTKVLRMKKDQQLIYISQSESLLDDLYVMRLDEEGNPQPVLMSEVRLFRLREVRDHRAALEKELAAQPSFLWPFIQDEKKLKKEQLKIKLETAQKIEEFLDGFSTEYESLQRKITQAKKELQPINKKMERLKTYYHAPASTKWKVLALYLVLALVLSLFMVYGANILDGDILG